MLIPYSKVSLVFFLRQVCVLTLIIRLALMQEPLVAVSQEAEIAGASLARIECKFLHLTCCSTLSTFHKL